MLCWFNRSIWLNQQTRLILHFEIYHLPTNTPQTCIFPDRNEGKSKLWRKHFNPFFVNKGVKQGCVIALKLFGIFFAVLLWRMYQHEQIGPYSTLLGLRQRQIQSNTWKGVSLCRWSSHFPYDEATLQSLIDRLVSGFQLKINISKTVVITQSLPANQASFSLNGSPLERVEKFFYLGSVLSHKQQNWKSSLHVWQTQWKGNNKKLTIKTNVLVYQTYVLSTHLYGSETWQQFLRVLNTFNLHCLLKLLNIK